MTELSGDNSIPRGLKVKKAIDSMRFGKEEIEHYHSEPISKERAQELYEKMGRRGLNRKEAGLLSEYERVGLYRKYDGGEGMALVLASGYDGIPVSVFGKERTIMTSLEGKKYFSPYLSFLGKTEGVKKAESDMFRIPFAKESFSIVVLNNMDVFNRNFMAQIAPENSQGSVDPVVHFFKELRNFVEPGGRFVITDSSGDVKGLDKNMKEQLENNGWELISNGKSPALKHYILKAVETKGK